MEKILKDLYMEYRCQTDDESEFVRQIPGVFAFMIFNPEPNSANPVYGIPYDDNYRSWGKVPSEVSKRLEESLLANDFVISVIDKRQGDVPPMPTQVIWGEVVRKLIS